jgi:hypothetical protein
MTCVLQQLNAHRRPTELPGIVLAGDAVEIDERTFDCCAGTGRYFNDPLKPAVTCDLRNQLKAANDFYRRFMQCFASKYFDQKQMPVPQIDLDDEAAFLRWRRGELAAHRTQVKASAVDRLLGVGLLATWAYGYRTMIYGFEKGYFDGQFVEPKSWANLEGGNNLVILWGVSPTWDQEVAGFFEDVLEHTLRFNMRLWLGVDSAASAPIRGGKVRLPVHMQSSLNRISQTHVRNWLSRRSVSLLSEHFGPQAMAVEQELLAGGQR